MNKIELAKEVASRLSVPTTDALRFIDTMNEVITEAMMREEPVLIQNFGRYTVWEQAERMGRNPRTLQECTIPKRTSVKFKPGKGLMDRINGK